MNLSIGDLLNTIDDTFTQFEIKLWSLIKDEFNLNVQIEKFIRMNLSSKKERDCDIKSFQHSTKYYIGGELNSPAKMLPSKFIEFQNRLQKCEMQLWSFLDEKQMLKSVIEEMRHENNRIQMESIVNDVKPTTSRRNSNLSDAKPVRKRLKKKSQKKEFICDYCGLITYRKCYLEQHMLKNHTISENGVNRKEIFHQTINNVEINQLIFYVLNSSFSIYVQYVWPNICCFTAISISFVDPPGTTVFM